MIFAPSVSTVGQWFLKRRVTAMGSVLAGTGLGGIIYPIMIARLLLRTSKSKASVAITDSQAFAIPY